MSNFVSGVTLGSGDEVTRQTLYNMWANGTLGQIDAADLSENIVSIITGTGETNGSLSPGLILFDGYDQLWKVWVDARDNTGVSLWLAFGADRTDDAFLAAEPIPAGAAVRIDPTNGGRWVRRVAGWLDSGVVAFSQKESTAASGTWFAGGTMGIVYAWFPIKPAGNTETGPQGCLVSRACVPVTWAPGGLGENPGGFAYPAVLYGVPLYNVAPTTTVSEGSVRAQIFFTGPRWAGV